MSVNILYQFNDAYAVFAGVSMTSLFEHNRDIADLRVYVLDEDISRARKEELEDNARKYNRSITFYETKQLVEYMKEIGIPSYRNSYATNMKMFLPHFLEDDLDRLLYIDSDTIIKASIKSLYRMDMDGKSIAMGLDVMGGKHKLYIGHGREDNYYNAGIILFDVTRWKSEDCTQKIVDHVKQVRAHYMSPDQDLLNVVFKDNIAVFDLRNNLQPLHMAYTTAQIQRYFPQKNYYDKSVIQKALENPVILHTFRFLGEFPWHKDSLHPAVKEFDYYLKLSVWKGYQKLPTEQDGFVFKIERMLYRCMPKEVFLLIFKLNYDRFIYKASKASEKRENIAQM